MKSKIIPILCGLPIGLAPSFLLGGHWFIAYLLAATGITLFLGLCFMEPPYKSDGVMAWVFFISSTLLIGFLFPVFIPLLVLMYWQESRAG